MLYLQVFELELVNFLLLWLHGLPELGKQGVKLGYLLTRPVISEELCHVLFGVSHPTHKEEGAQNYEH
jgi:hypothetical protein